MAYQPAHGSWSPSAPTIITSTSQHKGQTMPDQQTSSSSSQANAGFQIPPYLTSTAQQAINDIGNQVDREYFKTIPGCLSTLTVGVSFLSFMVSSAVGHSAFFSLISGFSFWVSIIFLLINLFQIPSKYSTLPWIQFEFLYLAVWTLLYFFCTIFLIFWVPPVGILALLCTIVFGYSTFQKLLEHHRFLANQQSSSASSPTLTHSV